MVRLSPFCCLVGVASISWLVAVDAEAQQPLTATTPVTYDFADFRGDGFAPEPAAGQLDSDEWRVTGVSDGDSAFGDTLDADTDYGRRTSEGGEVSGGVYAFDVDDLPVGTMQQFALGVQPTGSDFTPGSLDLRVQNATGNILRVIDLSFVVYVRNDGERAQRLSVSIIRESDGASVTVDALQTDTELAAGTTSLWGVSTMRSAVIDLDALGAGDVMMPGAMGPTGIPVGENLIIRFHFDDLEGSGSRDEIAIDDIAVSIPSCGNYMVDSGEACDDGDITTETECPYGEATCTLCNATCSMELSLTGRACGDGTTDSLDGETCDDGNTETETECDYGTPTCMACSGDCSADLELTGRFCGDGNTDGGDMEVCDDGNTATETECAYGTPTCMACSGDCGAALSLTGRFCGDMVTDMDDGEECDDGNSADGDGCSSTCIIEMLDAGMAEDAGAPEADAGAMLDAGGPEADAGGPEVDAGGPLDAGDPLDAGGPEADAGMSMMMDDGSAPSLDAGPTEEDAGSPPDDDASTPAIDAGAPEADAGDGGIIMEGGCGCSAPGQTRTGLSGGLALGLWSVGLLGFLAARRRRRL